MSIQDLFLLLQWWGLFFILGLLFFPFTGAVLSTFPDKGYAFAKIIGLVIVSYCLLIFGILHILPFTRTSVIAVTFFLGIIFFISGRPQKIFSTHWKFIIISEIIFLSTLFFWAYIRIHQPDIYGLEKYMDFGFVNSILKSTYFPPKDMWFSPYSINYYYFGHFMTAVLTKLSNISSAVTYNLMLASLFAFTFTLSYSLIFAITSFLYGELGKNSQDMRIKIFTFLTSLGTAALVSLGGNLHVLYSFFSPYKNENPVPLFQLPLALQTVPNAYWYPNATRFIFNTIHEFPIYSFVVSDLHGHVLDIPIVLTIIALLLQMFLLKQIKIASLILISFFLSTAYMTNAWDGAIYVLLTFFIICSIQMTSVVLNKKKHALSQISSLLSSSFLLNITYYTMLVVTGFFLFALPFSLYFKTGALVKGIGVLCAPNFLIKLQHIGPLLFEADHCQKSPIWQLFILYGFFYFFVFSFIVFLVRMKKILHIDIFIMILITLSSFLILIPEFLYMKDIYPAHYRANTMFKLTYEAFIMLSLASGYIIVRIVSAFSVCKTIQERILFLLFSLITGILVSLVFIYASFAITSYYNNLLNPKSLDGTTYLQNIHPDDYHAIQWINSSIQGQPIIVEAQGDSYTDYARISSNTGLPTILGWTVHEWLWRGSYDIPAPRISEIQTIYETKDPKQAKKILDKYTVSYIYVGDLERQKYLKLSEETIRKLGKKVYSRGKTAIYKVF